MKFKKYLADILIWCFLLLTYVPTFCWMWERWFVRDSYYSHGVLIPFVSLFFVWQRKEELVQIERQSSAWGMPLIILGMLIHVSSSLVRVYFTSGFSILITVAGIILYLYGKKIFRKVLFPVAFLIFMVPMPLVIITNVSFRMKIFAAEIAERLLNFMGIVSLREGSIIRMRSAYVIVDDVCSGLRSLISLMALGGVFAYWMRSTPIRRFLLFILTVPIAIITNVCRIIFLASLSEIYGPQFASGFMHDLSGYLVFAIAFILLYIFGKVVE